MLYSSDFQQKPTWLLCPPLVTPPLWTDPVVTWEAQSERFSGKIRSTWPSSSMTTCWPFVPRVWGWCWWICTTELDLWRSGWSWRMEMPHGSSPSEVWMERHRQLHSDVIWKISYLPKWHEDFLNNTWNKTWSSSLMLYHLSLLSRNHGCPNILQISLWSPWLSKTFDHLIIYFIEEVHSMIGNSRQQDAEGSFEARCSSPWLTNTYHLYFIIKFVLALISDSYDLLEIPWYCNLL